MHRSYLIVVILAIYSSGLWCNDKSLCVSLMFRARVCSFSTSMVKLEGNHPHSKSLSLSPSYQPVGGREGGREGGGGKRKRRKGW